jgi:signal peptidase II
MAAKYRAFVIAFALALLADQGTKIWARHELKPRYPAVVTIIPGFFDCRYSENPGALFGIGRGLVGLRVLLAVAAALALWLIYAYLRKAPPEARRVAVELGLLAGGAIGNIIDRVAFAKVTDFIVWHVGGWEWHTFNVADAALVIGAIGLLFDMRTTDKMAKAKKQPT